MYLKVIELDNFKTFRRKTRITLLPGFTAITGPNGSGKSNISDAILFVLGTKSSKLLRAQRLIDLVGKSTDDKYIAPYCKVSLVFDNQDKLIPLDASEVVFTRIVKLSPQIPDKYYSEFYINERRSSQTEFENILAHVRLSGEGYNIIQQGDINRVISMSLNERRKILEDVAGITKFDMDIDKAKKSEAVVNRDLEDLALIINERRQRLQQLKLERDEAIKYKELNDRLKLAKAQLLQKQKLALERELAEAKLKLKGYEDEREKLKLEIKRLHSEREKVEQELSDLEQKLIQRGGDEVKNLETEINNLKLEITRIVADEDNVRERLVELKRERSELDTELQNINREYKNIVKLRRATETKLDEVKTVLQANKSELNRLKAELVKSSSEVSDYQRKLTELEQCITKLQLERHELTLELDRVNSNLERYDYELAELEQELQNYEFTIQDLNYSKKELQKQERTLASELRNLTEQFMAKKNLSSKLELELEKFKSKIDVLDRKYNRLKSELEIRVAVQQGGYSRAVTAILEARDRGLLRGIHGTIAELSNVADDYKDAVVAALGSRLQSIVVANDEVVAEAITYLKRHKLGRCTFLPLNKLVTSTRPRPKALMIRNEPDVEGFLIDFVKYDKRYESAFLNVFSDTLVVSNFDSLRKFMGGVRLVTKSGEVAEPSGAVIGGSLQQSLTIKFGKQMESELQKLATELRDANERYNEIKTELQTVQKTLRELENKVSKKREQLNTVQTELKQLDQQQQYEFKPKLERLKIEHKQKSETVAKFMSHRTELENKLKAINEKLESAQNEQDELKSKLRKLFSKRTSEWLRKLETEVEAGETESRQLKSELDTLTTNQKLYEGRQNELKAKLERVEQALIDYESKLVKLGETKVERETHYRVLKKVEAELTTELTTLRAEIDNKQRAIEDLKLNISKYKERVNGFEDQILDTKSRCERLKLDLAEKEAEIQEWGVELDQKDKLPSYDTLRRTITECKRELEAFGSEINLKAIEDYERESKSLQELETRRKNLEREREILLSTVAELTKKKHDIFIEVFNQVNSNFQRIYHEISGGGKAELILEKPEQPFEGGLIIKARPPGKPENNLDALSGAEKSLTALTLLFAIQEFEPAPFYVLDEIDQHFDGVNAQIIAKRIKRNAQNIQIIVISLRKVTLQEADHIYGVTIQGERGSEIIGKVNLDMLADELSSSGSDDIKVATTTTTRQKFMLQT